MSGNGGNGGKKSNDAGSYDYVQGLTWDIAIFLHIDSLISSRRGFAGVSALSHYPNLLVSLHQRKACGIR